MRNCCSRFSGTSMGRCWSAASCSSSSATAALVLNYFEHALPVNPRQCPRVYRLAVEPLTAELGPDSPHLNEFLSILASLENMPAYTEQDPESIAERQREKEVARARLARLVQDAAGRRARRSAKPSGSSTARRATRSPSTRCTRCSKRRPTGSSYWRTASHEINYRRFFDVNTLAGLRVEEPDVFAATHRVARAAAAPTAACRASGSTIRTGCSTRGAISRCCRSSPRQRVTARATAPTYVVAEKILSGRETLPAAWNVHGTTGYNFLNDLNGIFVDAAQARRLRRIYAKLTGRIEAFDDVLYDSKQLIMADRDGERAERPRARAGPHRRGQPQVARLHDGEPARRHPRSRRVLPCLPDLRRRAAAGRPRTGRSSSQAITRARRRNPAMEASLFDFFREVVLPRSPEDRRLGPSGRRAPGRLSAGRRTRGARTASLRDEAAAVHRAGAGEGPRRYRVLPLQRAAVGERGWRRSRPDRTLGRGVSPGEPSSRPGMAVRACWPRPPTTRRSARTCARAST